VPSIGGATVANAYKIMPNGSKQPFFTIGNVSGGSGGGGDGGGTSDYDQLSHKPIANLSGDPIVIATLLTGVYKITGSWSLLDGSAVTAATDGGIFFVENTPQTYKVTVLQANSIVSAACPVDGTEADIIVDNMAMGGSS
jgi:hypothetical protein